MTSAASESQKDAAKERANRYVLEFTLPGLPRSANGSHGHWRVKHAQTKRWKQAVFTKAWPFKPPQPLTSAALTLTRMSSVEPDFDNLVAGFKPIIDGLRQAGVLSDDKRVNVGRPDYRWEYAPPKAGRVRVRVEGA